MTASVLSQRQLYKSLDLRQDGIRCGSPNEWLAVVDVLVRKAFDVGDQIVDVRNVPRRMASWVMRLNQLSTWLSHEA